MHIIIIMFIAQGRLRVHNNWDLELGRPQVSALRLKHPWRQWIVLSVAGVTVTSRPQLWNPLRGAFLNHLRFHSQLQKECECTKKWIFGTGVALAPALQATTVTFTLAVTALGMTWSYGLCLGPWQKPLGSDREHQRISDWWWLRKEAQKLSHSGS